MNITNTNSNSKCNIYSNSKCDNNYNTNTNGLTLVPVGILIVNVIVRLSIIVNVILTV